MQIPKPLLLAFLGSASLSIAEVTQVDIRWSDNVSFANPITDNSDTALQGGDVVQAGYFVGVDPNKDPSTYSAADWASFTPLTGDGSPNQPFYPTGIATLAEAPALGFFVASVPLDTDDHVDVPLTDVRIGIRFYDANTVAGANHFNIVTSTNASWIMAGAIVPDPFPPTPADANMDVADSAGTLVWQGSAFKTDLVPGDPPPTLVLTDVTQTGPTSLQISWTGGDGSNDVQTSTDGINFTTVSPSQSSPATITVNPTSTAKFLVRVIEP